MGKILFNDRIVDRDTFVDIEDRAYQFGDGIYEVIGVYNRKLFLMDEHLVRLQRSAKEIQLDLQTPVEELREKLEQLIETNNIIDGIVYLQISRGVAPRSHEFPIEKITPTIVAYTKTVGDFTEIHYNGVAVIIDKDIRWLRCDIKSLNLLPNAMSKQKAADNGAFEAILHRDNVVTEASSSNIFIVKSGELYTHPANNFILNGITRQQVFKICAEKGIKINEQTFTVDELLQADEVFLTGTRVDVVSITKVDDQTINDGTPGEITQQLIQAFHQLTSNL